MGTPNRQPTATVDWLEFVAGEAIVPPEDISAETLRELVNRVIRQCMPYFSYMPDFSPIKDLRNQYFRTRNVPGKIEFLEPGITEETTCLNFGVVSTSEHREGEEVKSSRVTLIIMARDGSLIKWLYETIDSETTHVKYSFLGPAGLLDLLERQPDWVNTFLRTLRGAIGAGIMRREIYISNMKKLQDIISGIQSKIAKKK